MTAQSGLNNLMLDEIELESHVRLLIIDVCEVLHRHGYAVVSVGALMRLVGVTEERARRHDLEFFSLDEDFADVLKESRAVAVPKNLPDGTTLH